MDVEILIERFDCASYRLAELEAALPGGRRVLNDVHHDRDDPDGPSRWLTEEQREGDGKSVVDAHLVDHRHVELVENKGLGEVTGQLGMTLNDGDGSWPEAFIGDGELVGASDGERGDDLERERGRVVVVDENDDVGVFLFDPLFGPLVAGEQRCPVVGVGLLEINGRADCGYVTGGDSRGDSRHLAMVLD